MPSYWPTESGEARRQRLVDVCATIPMHLDREMTGSADMLSLPAIGSSARQDALDAVICAWDRFCVLAGRTTFFGDGMSAIWVPRGIPTKH